MSTNAFSSADFQLANMADDLLALEGNCRNLVLKMDERFDNRLREAGYELKIEGRSVEICPVQSRN